MMGDKAASLLVEMFHVSPSILHPDARLAEDLGIDGDDAKVFFAELRTRYGTDFSQLDASWSRHFRSETEVWLDDINKLGMIMLIALLVAAVNSLIQQAEATTACVGCFARPPVRKSISLKDVSKAVARGHWVSDNHTDFDQHRL